MDLKEQGRRVRAARAYLGVNADDLSKRVGIGKSTLLKIERGQRIAKHYELLAIAVETGVRLESFEAERWAIEDQEATEGEEIVDDVAEADDQEEQQNGESAAGGDH